MVSRLGLVIVLSGWCLSTGLAADASEGGEYRPESEKLSLLRGAWEPWRKVQNWRIDSEAVSTGVGPGKGVPIHRSLLIAAPGQFYGMGAHFPPHHPWQVDPFCQELFLDRGQFCHRWPFSRMYSEGRLKPGSSLPGSAQTEVLFAVFPVWILTDYRAPVAAGGPVVPFEAVSSPEYHLLAGRQSRGGEDCVMVEKAGVDRLWLAAGKGLCLMQRDTREPNSGQLIQRIVTDKLQEVAAGLWLPSDFRRQLFAAVPGTNGAPELEQEARIHVLRCDINGALTPSAFWPTHAPGSLKFEGPNKFAQVSAGGEDLLDNYANFMVKYLHLSPTRGRWFPFIWFLPGLGGGLLAGFALLRADSRATKPSPPVRELAPLTSMHSRS